MTAVKALPGQLYFSDMPSDKVVGLYALFIVSVVEGVISYVQFRNLHEPEVSFDAIDTKLYLNVPDIGSFPALDDWPRRGVGWTLVE